MGKPTLILDADDTLWATNIFYEKATQAFVERMAREGFSPTEAREIFEEVERERVPLAGYSPIEFARSKAVAYRKLCQLHGRQPEPQVEEEVEAIGRQVLDFPIVLLEGVAETIPALSQRFRLILLTKGDPRIQQDKLARSGLSPYFEAIHVVPEKGPDVLRELMGHYGLAPRETWVVGDSPRSDINPALKVGFGAIYIPSPEPWSFERVPFADPDRVIILERFSELLDLFPDSEAPE